MWVGATEIAEGAAKTVVATRLLSPAREIVAAGGSLEITRGLQRVNDHWTAISERAQGVNEAQIERKKIAAEARRIDLTEAAISMVPNEWVREGIKAVADVATGLSGGVSGATGYAADKLQETRRAEMNVAAQSSRDQQQEARASETGSPARRSTEISATGKALSDPYRDATGSIAERVRADLDKTVRELRNKIEEEERSRQGRDEKGRTCVL
jgi:hypothetical protein